MPDDPIIDPDEGAGRASAGKLSELLHSTGASLHTPESFGRAVISAALTTMAKSDTSLDGGTVPATFSIKSLRSESDSPPACIDVCVGIAGAEVCIHVEIPTEILSAIF